LLLESLDANRVIFIFGYAVAFASLRIVADLMLDSPDSLLEDAPHLLTTPELLGGVFVLNSFEFVDGVPKEDTLFLAVVAFSIYVELASNRLSILWSVLTLRSVVLALSSAVSFSKSIMRGFQVSNSSARSMRSLILPLLVVI